MSRILVIGGYGGFGGRLSRRLAESGHPVLVAGRELAKAERFCAGRPNLQPARLDRGADVTAALAALRPALVVDAAGPFQGSGYAVPEACIAARIPYLDLADARDFVCGIGRLDGAARAAGVAVIAGASTLPALSAAVALRLAEGLDRVEAVEMALSAPNGGGAGGSVVKAVLSYVGRPVRLWRGRRWGEAAGWQEMRREDFTLRDGSGVRRRLVAIADVPDCGLLPGLLPGRPAVTFRAGTELGFQMVSLWLASWPVRWRWMRSLRPAAPVLLALYRATRRLGGERSAMKVELKGRAGNRALERRWTLIGERGDGPFVPTLAAALIAEDILAGRVEAGARHAGGILKLERFDEAFEGLAVRHECDQRALPPPLYARVGGQGFEELPDAVRRLHDFHGDSGAEGEATVERGRSTVARILASAMRMPPPGRWPLHVEFRERGGIERWTRDFGGHRFTSELRASGGRLVERFGAVRLLFDLPCGRDGLEMRLRRWSFFGLPMPRALAPRIIARETERNGRFAFEVEVSLPWGPRIVRYAGTLGPVETGEEVEAFGARNEKGGPPPDRPDFGAEAAVA